MANETVNLDLNDADRIINNFLKFNNQIGALVDDEQSYEDFFNLYRFSIYNMKNFNSNELKLFSIYKCESLFAQIIKHISSICMQLDFCTQKINYIELTSKASLNERRISILSYLLVIVNRLVFKLIEFNIKFCKQGLGSLIELIRNESLIKSLNEKNQKITFSLIYLLTTLSKYYESSPEVKQAWQTYVDDIHDDLLRVCKVCNNVNLVRSAYLIIANTTCDEEKINDLPEIYSILRSYTQDLKVFGELFKTSSNLVDNIERETIQLFDTNKEIKESRICHMKGIEILYNRNKFIYFF
jgi:hypothetical protein